ncbi:MAG: hypothetical protein M3112_00355 [Actinomycetia bacterium]|nr:hypothetical protein [Actinomycetes bacterium]
MESEEFEQIPWASLVAEQREGVDRRIYLAVGIVGLLVAVVFGMRLFSGGSQPTPPLAVAIEPPPTTLAATISPSPPQISMVVAESDLRVATPETAQGVDQVVQVTAEWFVIDWFTRDGSQETIRSIKSALSPEIAIDTLPHETDGESVTFVEWAKTVDAQVTADGFDVTIAYRAIRETEDGFVRDPVKTVGVSLEHQESDLVVSALPSGS